MKVVLTWYAHEGEARQVREALPPGAIVSAPPERPHLSRLEATYEDLATEAEDADALMGWMVPPGIFERARRLKALAYLHAGCDDLDLAMLKRRGVQVANVRGANAIPV